MSVNMQPDDIRGPVVRNIRKDSLPGGLADNADDSKFDKEALQEGIKVEMEHTNDPSIAKEIAKDHLSESPNYYKELKKMESKLEKEQDNKKAKIKKSDSEDLCVLCGLCCQASIPGENGERIIVKGLSCKFLKSQGDCQSVCTVYENRFEKAPWCLSLEKGMEYGSYPSLCPYVIGKSNYVGKVLLSDEEYAKVEPAIIKSFMSKGQPEWVSHEDWISFIGKLEDQSLLKSAHYADFVDVTTEFDWDED